MLILTGANQRWHDAGHDVHRDGKADTTAAAGRGLDLVVDANHLAALVEQRPTRVTRIDSRIGLDGFGDAEAVTGWDAAPQGADDALRHGACQTKGIANGDH